LVSQMVKRHGRCSHGERLEKEGMRRDKAPESWVTPLTQSGKKKRGGIKRERTDKLFFAVEKEKTNHPQKC